MSNNDAFSLAGKTFLVTGGTRGIGRAISIRFAEAGGSVIAVYVRNQEAAGSLKAEAGERGLQIECLRADLTRPAGMEAIDGLLTGLDTNLSGLVHCAATGVHKDADRFSSRDIKWVFSLNFEAFVGLVSMLLPRMDEGSSIIALSSKGATHSVPAYGLVGASKGALEAYSRQLAAELATRKIRVNIITPGPVLTEAWDVLPNRDERLGAAVARTPLGRLVLPEDVAYTAQFLCCDASSGIVGHTLVVDGGADLPE
jgi:NAD(P)-dependent dehydrogenase (short-subunit alcohol dehydrogenase family)